jgi:hypothetical protein
MTTLADLLTTETWDTLLDRMLTTLRGLGFPTGSWHTTSVPRRLLTAVAQALSQASTLIYQVTSGGLLETSSSGWLTLLAKNVFGLTRTPARTTIGTFEIEDTGGTGPHSIAAGQLYFATATGLQFVNTTAFTVGLLGDADFEVMATTAGAAWNVAADMVTVMQTPIPGLTFKTGETSFNPASDWITTEGLDEQDDESLKTDCINRWATLGYGQNADWWEYQIKLTPVYGSGFARVSVVTASAGEGELTLYVGGTDSTISGAAEAAAQSYANDIKGACETIIVQACGEETITCTAVIYAYAAYAAGAKAKAETALREYLRTIPVGQTFVYYNQIVDALQYSTTEVRNVVMTVPAADVALAADEIPVIGSFAGVSVVSV